MRGKYQLAPGLNMCGAKLMLLSHISDLQSYQISHSSSLIRGHMGTALSSHILRENQLVMNII